VEKEKRKNAELGNEAQTKRRIVKKLWKRGLEDEKEKQNNTVIENCW
jgi:hypothetical protein